MTAFQDAAAYVLPFGKFMGQKIDDVAKTHRGLLYLDWMRSLGKKLDFHTGNALATYLDDPTIAADLAKLVKR